MQRNAFVGRHRDLREIAALLGEGAVVTLIGVGGVGKTRLALQVADEAVPRFPRLLDANDHRVGSDERVDIGVAESDFSHPRTAGPYLCSRIPRAFRSACSGS
jgi:ABC-type branched-subunit amino acid transport system ATPase component